MRSILKLNKKAAVTDIIIWIVVAFVTLLFLGLWLYMHNTLTNVLESVPTSNGINISGAAHQTIGQVNTAEQKWLPILAFVVIVAEALSLFVTSFFVKEHPVLYIPFALIVMVAVVVSVFISNAYQGLLTGSSFSSTLLQFSAADFILIYLPYWTAIVGIVALVLSLAGITIDKGSGGIST